MYPLLLLLLCFVGLTAAGQENYHLHQTLHHTATSSPHSFPVNVDIHTLNHFPNNRKLSQSQSQTEPLINPYPARPTPLPHTSQPPIHSSIGFSLPSNLSPSHSPPLPPPSAPAPFNTLPPCKPSGGGGSFAPAPETEGSDQKLWCVAKPSVPVGTLQEALDYACGEGGADCEEIKPNGSCFVPDSVVAHASYAFNSYWQKYKRSGGGVATCSFGGTAMIINSDPSFMHCRFVLS